MKLFKQKGNDKKWHFGISREKKGQWNKQKHV